MIGFETLKKFNIAIASDHAGYNLKQELAEYLKTLGHTVEDLGTNSLESCDYPLFAFKVAEAVTSNKADKGILVCATGQGIAMAANKVKGARAFCCTDSFSAQMTVKHNDANILTLGEKITGSALARDIVSTWLQTEFEGGRHQRRVNQVIEYESNEFAKQN